MDDDAYGYMLKMPHIKPVDRQKYRKVIEMKEKYIAEIENLSRKYKVESTNIYECIKDNYDLLIKYGDISSVLSVPWLQAKRDVLIEERGEIRNKILDNINFDISGSYELIDELGWMLNIERLDR